MNIGFIKYIADIGVRKNYQPWEIYLTRKLNFSAALGFTNVLLAMISLVAVGFSDSVPECVAVLLMAPGVLLLNKYFGYKPAAYLFTFIGCFLFYFLALKMGQDSLAFLCYLPLIVGIVQMTARKEMFIHMLVMLSLCFLSVIFTLVSYEAGWYEVQISSGVLKNIKNVNIFFSFFTTICFLIVISKESIRQEMLLKSAVVQKETLLAELHHRVKNNLNIVNSLLNLKKGSVESNEAQHALDECRNLVFSMSLVHNKIYTRDKIDSLNFAHYLKDLSKDLVNSLGGNADLILNVGTTEVNVDITHAIPCGLIINELMTNSFKHGRLTGRSLKLQIDLKTEGDSLFLKYRDNGPGISGNVRAGSVGLDLVKALADQLDADYNFNNDEGMVFKMSFPYNQCAIN